MGLLILISSEKGLKERVYEKIIIFLALRRTDKVFKTFKAEIHNNLYLKSLTS